MHVWFLPLVNAILMSAGMRPGIVRLKSVVLLM